MLKTSRPSDCQLSFSQLGENPRRTTCSGYARDEEPSALALPDTLDPLVVDCPARLAQERGCRLDTAAPTSASSELPVAIEIAGPIEPVVLAFAIIAPRNIAGQARYPHSTIAARAKPVGGQMGEAHWDESRRGRDRSWRGRNRSALFRSGQQYISVLGGRLSAGKSDVDPTPLKSSFAGVNPFLDKA